MIALVRLRIQNYIDLSRLIYSRSMQLGLTKVISNHHHLIFDMSTRTHSDIHILLSDLMASLFKMLPKHLLQGIHDLKSHVYYFKLASYSFRHTCNHVFIGFIINLAIIGIMNSLGRIFRGFWKPFLDKSKSDVLNDKDDVDFTFPLKNVIPSWVLSVKKDTTGFDDFFLI